MTPRILDEEKKKKNNKKWVKKHLLLLALEIIVTTLELFIKVRLFLFSGSFKSLKIYICSTTCQIKELAGSMGWRSRS